MGKFGTAYSNAFPSSELSSVEDWYLRIGTQWFKGRKKGMALEVSFEFKAWFLPSGLLLWVYIIWDWEYLYCKVVVRVNWDNICKMPNTDLNMLSGSGNWSHSYS